MKTKIVVIILPQQGTLLGFKQQGKTKEDASLGLGSAVAKKGKIAVKRQKKKAREANRSLIVFFFAFSPHYGTWSHARRYPPCRLLTARHHQDHTPEKPAPFLDEKQGSWLQEVPRVVEKVMNLADQRVLQLLIWSSVPTRDVRVQIFPQPAKTCFYWFTLFWHQREKDYRSRVCSGRSDRGVWSELRERGKIKEEERERERVPSLSLHITSHHVTSRSHSTSLLTSPHPLIFFFLLTSFCPVTTIWTPGTDQAIKSPLLTVELKKKK